MIKYNLKCSNDHEFESWFSASDKFDKLKRKKLLECIFCRSKQIDKSIMSPTVSRVKRKNNDLNFLNKKLKDEKIQLLELKRFVKNNFEYVGENFSRKVREIHYGKESKNIIYGKTTPEEKKELEEEGIELLSIPWISKDN
jgi:hypothetical protein